HEMGRNQTFFFQPGVPSRNHPLTPDTAFALTRGLAHFHAAALDEVGALYYSEENFDDFYYGKGSTYPDIQGGIGILFEQASARGHLTDTDNGLLSFPFAIRNQVRTSLSTLAGAQALRPRLLAHQQAFFKESLAWGQARDTAAWHLSPQQDRVRVRAFLELMDRHQIRVLSTEAGGWVIPLGQAQARLIQAMFERRTHFQDSVFYDVSAWTLPLAFGLPWEPLSPAALKELGSLEPAQWPEPGHLQGRDEEPYAWAFGWEGYYAPRLLDRLLAAGLKARVATRPFSSPAHSFGRGSIVIPVQGQTLTPKEIRAKLATWAPENGVDVYPLPSGLTEGINLGSNYLRPISRPRVLVVAGKGVSAYEVGEVWHLLDQRYQMQVSLVAQDQMSDIPLHTFSTIVMVSGSYGYLNLPGDRLRDWLVQGGTLIATKSALNWLKNEGLGRVELIRIGRETDGDFLPYEAKDQIEGAQEISGAICAARWDLTHPLAFGYTDSSLSVLRNSRVFMEPSGDPFGTPLRFSEAPLQSGYISPTNLEQIAGSAVVNVSRVGRGHVVAMSDNPNFRAFWYGTNKLFLNAIFFSPMID
ncbi:MAG: zinc carboxypeptidase, partial [Bacteroidetes bacterium]